MNNYSLLDECRKLCGESALLISIY